jgi:2-phospho-L-lactate guanylyltransferase
VNPPSSWHVVLPVKEADLAKTRLEPPPPLTRAELARAMARDTLETVCAAVAPALVAVVTSDPAAAASAGHLGARVVPDPGRGLNAAVQAGVAAVTRSGPVPVAVLLGDLPSARPQDLATALVAASEHPRAVLPDADGTGTVLLTSLRGTDLVPAFGPGSARRHAADARVLELDLPRLRTDVDDARALAAVAHLGVGRHTAAVLARAWRG